MPALRVAVYVRMSKDRQEDSPERQRGQVLPYCERQGYQVVGEYLDPGITGDEFAKRKALQRLLRDAADGKFEGIVVDHKDRLSRQNYIDYVSLVVRPLRDAGVWVETVAGGRVDWGSLGGMITDHVGQAQASAESPKIGYRTLSQLLAKARDGRGVGGPVPYGYVMTYDEAMVYDNRNRGRTKRVPLKYALGDPDKVARVRWLFQQYAAGWTVERLRDELHRRGVPGPKGTEWWGKTTIARLLANRRYVGDWVYNRKHCGKWATSEGGTVREPTGHRRTPARRNPESEWVVVPDWHPAIIDRETFARVQARLRDNRERKTPLVGGGDFRLNQLLVCGSCGLLMSGFHKGGERRYRCSGNLRFGAGFCGCNTAREVAVLDAVVDAVQASLLDPEGVGRTRDELRRRAAEARDSGEAERLRGRLADLGRQIDRGNTNLTIVPADRVPGLVAKLRELESERSRLADALKRLDAESDLHDFEALVGTAEALLWDLRAAVAEGEAGKVRTLLRALVSKVVLDFKPRAGKRNRSPLLGGMVYLRDEAGDDAQGAISFTVRSHMHHALAALRKSLEPRLR